MNNISDNYRNVLLVLTLPFLLFLVHAFYYYPFLIDDAFISLRYAERLVNGHGLNWNDGERVEGYSNLLWVLLAAGFMSLKFDPVAIIRIIGILSAAAAMGALDINQRRTREPLSSLLIGNLAFALTAPVAIWAMAGLESALVTALLAWIYALCLPLLENPDRRAGHDRSADRPRQRWRSSPPPPSSNAIPAGHARDLTRYPACGCGSTAGAIMHGSSSAAGSSWRSRSTAR